MKWTPRSILSELKRRHGRGESISYRALAARHRPLVSAAAYHFGSYQAAVVRAGIDYADVTQRPRWTKERIIRLIKAARKAGRDLSWIGVAAGRNAPLRRAAFASLQPRMFGGWPRALQAAGVDADEARRYRTWDRTSVVLDLKQRKADGEKMNSGAVQREDPALHAAAVRYFGSFDKALVAARLDPAKLRQRKRSTRTAGHR